MERAEMMTYTTWK